MSDPKDVGHACTIDGCPETAQVGLGWPTRWFCMEHYEAEMADYGKRVRAALAAAQEPQRGA